MLLPRWVTEARGLRADLIALAAGALAALALPPLHLLPVLLVAFPVLLAQINASGRAIVAARRGWWFGFGYHLIGLYWITEAILFEAARFWWFVPLAVPALAAVLAVFVAVPAWIAWFATRGQGRVPAQTWRTASPPSADGGRAGGQVTEASKQSVPAQVMTLAGGWVLADLARQFVATGFPWNPLGSVWAAPGWFGDVMLQPAALVSVHGLTLATVVLACSPALRWRGRGLCLVLLLAWIGFGVNRMAEPPPPDQVLRVVLVQGNVPQGQKWDRTLLISIFERYLRLTADGLREAGPGPHVVVWPETASPFQLETDTAAREAIAAAGQGEPVLAGAVRFDEADRPHNTLFAVTGAGDIAALYDKWHLVPFGEYQPSWAQIGIQLVPGGGFARGPGPETLHVPGLPPVAPLICYEAIFPGQVVNEADRPDWMINVTNDAWFGTSAGPRQHLAAARLRAVEEGLPLLRAANTGITIAFDSRGHEITRLGMQKTGFRTVTLPGSSPRTVFARFGLVMPGALALGSLVVGLVMSRGVRKG
jgi:apolipoprotein N-acyltransferase